MSLSNLIYIFLIFIIPYIIYFFYYKKTSREISNIEKKIDDSFSISELNLIQKDLFKYSISSKFNRKLRLRIGKLKNDILHKMTQLENLKK